MPIPRPARLSPVFRRPPNANRAHRLHCLQRAALTRFLFAQAAEESTRIPTDSDRPAAVHRWAVALCRALKP